MTEEAASLQEQLRWVKFRMQILDMIENKLIEMKALAEQVRDGNLGDGDIVSIQDRVNQLVKEVNELEKIQCIEVVN